MTLTELQNLTPTSLGLPPKTKIGVSCTAVVLLQEYVASLDVPKLILHRDFKEINNSLISIGMTPFAIREQHVFERALLATRGIHVIWSDLFNPDVAASIWEQMELPGPFNCARHAELSQYRIEPYHDKVIVQGDAARDYAERLRATGVM